MPPSDSLIDSALPEMETAPPISPSLPSANGDEQTALARLEDDGGPPSPTAEPPEPPSTLSLEQRVRRLEEFVTLLQDHRSNGPRPASPPSEGRPIPPVAPTAIRLDVSKPPPVATAMPSSIPGLASSLTRSSVLWLLWETWAESRAIVRMFVDPRYNLPWSARVLPLVLLAAILTSQFWVPFSSIPLLGGVLVKLADLLLAFLLFKWLGHEARRYRQTSPDLPANLRL